MITLHVPLMGYAEREPPKFNRQEWGLWSAYLPSLPFNWPRKLKCINNDMKSQRQW